MVRKEELAHTPSIASNVSISNDQTDDKLILTSITDYQSPDSWSQTMQLELFEVGILSFFLILMFFSIRKR